MALIMWLVMAAITVAGFAAFEANHDVPPTTSTSGAVADVLSIVGGVGRAAVPTAPGAETTPSTATPTVVAPFIPPPEVERWRPLVLAFFPADEVSQALEVMWCESRGDSGATHALSGAAGLFQHLPEFWDERSVSAGFTGGDVHDPETNIGVAGWLFHRDGWSHWVASEACWGS